MIKHIGDHEIGEDNKLACIIQLLRYSFKVVDLLEVEH
jgi:hypothetical protein